MLTNYIKQSPLSLLTALAIIILSLIPFPEVEMVQDIPLADKWVHFIMYGGLSGITWLEMTLRERKSHDNLFLTPLMLRGLVIPAILGGVLELAQEYLTTTRSGDMWDFIADAIGALLGTAFGMLLRALIKRKKDKENR